MDTVNLFRGSGGQTPATPDWVATLMETTANDNGAAQVDDAAQVDGTAQVGNDAAQVDGTAQVDGN